MESVVYVNGSLVPLSQARISPNDYGFLHGYGLFETMRAYSGRIFRLDRHLQRLAHSAKAIDIPHEGLDLEKTCYDTLKANPPAADARVRLTVTLGESNAVPDTPAHAKPTVVVIAQPYAPPPAEKYREGYQAIISGIRRNSQSPLSGLKTLNYLDNMLARKEAKAAAADEALLLNERGLLCEGSASNIFLVSEGALVTPSKECGILVGITREVVAELAHQMKLPVLERGISPDDLFRADEAFITNSLIEIAALTWVDGKTIGKGVPGETTLKLMEAYKTLAEKETGRLPSP